jgi:2Fe-2S ferredoxin
MMMMMRKTILPAMILAKRFPGSLINLLPIHPRSPTRRFLSNNNNNLPVIQWLISKGVEERIAVAMMKSFPSPPSISDLQLFGKAGIKALADAVQKELETQKNLQTVKVNVRIPKENRVVTYDAVEGQSFYDLVLEHKDLASTLECACRGIAACSTCHVYVDTNFLNKLPASEEAELDMLDLAWGYSDNSRLGCQIKFTKEVDGITVTIPQGVNNLYSPGT